MPVQNFLEQIKKCVALMSNIIPLSEVNDKLAYIAEYEQEILFTLLDGVVS